VLPNNAIAMRGQEENSEYRSSTVPSSKTTTPDFGGYVALDEYLETRAATLEWESGQPTQ
jgi:hypothetical protein